MNLKTISCGFVLSSVLGLCTFAAVYSSAQSPTQVSRAGTVSCSFCNGKHSRPKLKIYTNLSCTDYCVRNMGSNYVLVVGNDTYTLDGDRHQLEKFAGGSATVTGNFDGAKLKVAEIEPVRNKK